MPGAEKKRDGVKNDGAVVLGSSDSFMGLVAFVVHVTSHYVTQETELA